jgi:hypothetical protein
MVQSFKVTNAVPVAGFNPDFINFSWNASGSEIIYPILINYIR